MHLSLLLKIVNLAYPMHVGLSGLIQLQEGDWLFARDVKSDGDPMQDIVQAFVSERYVFFSFS